MKQIHNYHETMKYISALFATLFSVMIVKADIYDSFTAKTAEGYTMTFLITNADTKTCSVSNLHYMAKGKVTIPENVEGYTVTAIGKEAFKNRIYLTDVVIPMTITTIEDCAFQNCKLLTELTIPNSVEHIGIEAFDHCEKIEKIILSESLKTINSGTFCGCRNLGKIEIPTSVEKIGSGAFRGCENLVQVIFPEFVSEIDDEAFTDCHSLKIVNLPNHIKHLGNSIFADCSNLNNIVIPNGIEKIPAGTFSGCSNLSSIELPESVIEIGEYAFTRCGFEAIDIPKNVTTIEEEAFSDCENLSEFTIPKRVNFIGKNAFALTAWMNSQTDDIVYKDNILLCCRYTSESFYTLNVQSGTRLIAEHAIWNDEHIQEVLFPSSVKNICRMAFADCLFLATIKFTEGLEKIGDYAFSGCERLKEISPLPSSVIEIGYKAFSGCPITSFSIPEGITEIKGLFSFCTSLTSITLPQSLKVIGDDTFGGCIMLSSIDIPDGVVKIGNSAFASCESLSSISLPKTLSVIESRSFQDCIGLQSVGIPNSITSIEDYAFAGCVTLSKISLPENIEYIGSSAFDDTKWYNDLFASVSNGLVYADNILFGYKGTLSGDIKIAPGTRIIAGSALANSPEVNSVTLPDGIVSIGDNSFQCGITIIQLPKGLKRIGRNAFSSCNNLKFVTIPEGVEMIESEAFCTLLPLTVFSFIKKPAKSDYVLFGDVDYYISGAEIRKSCNLFVPIGTKELYTKTEGWNNFLFTNEMSSNVIVDMIKMIAGSIDETFGDINQDSIVDIVDIVAFINYMNSY